MPLEARKYLYDIQQATVLIDGFCAGKSFADDQRIQCAAGPDTNSHFRVLRQFAAGCANRYT